MCRFAKVVAALVLVAAVASTGSAWAAAPVPPSPGSTWTDREQSTAPSGISLPQGR